MSSVAVMAAITILNLTIFFLDPNIDAASTDVSNNGAANIPGIIAFAISGSIFVVILLAALLSAIATKVLSTMSGFKAMIATMYGAQSHDEDALKNWRVWRELSLRHLDGTSSIYSLETLPELLNDMRNTILTK